MLVTELRPIQSAIILVMKQVGLLLRACSEPFDFLKAIGV